ncbi:MAG: response regulator transcription factor [Burkholderiaceae bacterium]
MKSARILIVDDEPKIVHLLAANLESWGFSTLGHHSGAAALAAIEQYRPDLVLLDLMMPGMDGFATLRAIRAFSRVPVIFVSARDQTIDKITGFELGADDYVAKPFVLDELLARIHAVLRRSSETPFDLPGACSELINGPLRLDLAEHRFWVGTSELHLTNVEFKLIAALMKKLGAVMTHEWLLTTVWGKEHIDHPQWLRVAVTRVRAKIRSVDPAADLIETCHGVGYSVRRAAAQPD